MLLKNKDKYNIMYDNINTPPWMQGPKPKNLQELREERMRLEELQRIKKLKQVDVQRKQAERQERIRQLKILGGGIVKTIQAGHQKISAFEQSRRQAKPIIGQIRKKKSIYD